MSKQGGFVLLELLLAILLIEIGILGCSQLLIESLAAQINLDRSLEALQILRGEMEKLERIDYMMVQSQSSQEIKPGIYYSLEVSEVDEDGDLLSDYKIVKGQVTWERKSQQDTSYWLYTYFYH